MTINENKKLSRNKKRGIQRKIEMDDNMKLLLNNKTEEKKKNKSFDDFKQLDFLLVRIKYANNPDKLESALKELKKIQVINKKLHEIKNEILVDYTSEFEMVGNLKVGDQVKQTHIRFRKISDYESYINATDEGYDAEDAIFNGYIDELDTPQFNKIKRS